MSNLRQLDWKDLLNWIFVAFVWAVLTWLLDWLQSGFIFSIEQLKVVAIAWLTAWVAYMIKRYFSNSEWTILGK